MNLMTYKGYSAKVSYDGDEGILYAKVLDVRDQISATGESVPELEESLRRAVDNYLEFCAERGREPSKPFSGKLQLRLSPSLHREAVLAAAECDMSLNQFFSECIETGVQSTRAARRKDPSIATGPLRLHLQLHNEHQSVQVTRFRLLHASGTKPLGPEEAESPKKTAAATEEWTQGTRKATLYA